MSEALEPTGKIYAACHAHAGDALDWMAPWDPSAPALIVKVRATARKNHRCSCGAPADWFLAEQQVSAPADAAARR